MRPLPTGQRVAGDEAVRRTALRRGGLVRVSESVVAVVRWWEGELPERGHVLGEHTQGLSSPNT